MKKKYLPVTYVDQDGVIWTKEQLKNKQFKRHERKQHEQKDDFTGYTYVHTIQPIENIREIPVTGSLF